MNPTWLLYRNAVSSSSPGLAAHPPTLGTRDTHESNPNGVPSADDATRTPAGTPLGLAVPWAALLLTLPCSSFAQVQAALPYSISRETTFFTEPLCADGRVDFAAALNQRRGDIQPATNAAIGLYRTIGPSRVEEKYRESLWRGLRIELPADERGCFRSIHDWAKENGLKDDEIGRLYRELERALAAPWSAERHPEFVAWLKVNAEPLAAIRAATLLPTFYRPFVRNPPEDILGSNAFREIARALAARSMLALRQDQLNAAWDDLLTLHRLARLVGQDLDIASVMLMEAFDRIACRGDTQFFEYAKLSPELARACADDLRRLPSRPLLREKLESYERAAITQAMLQMAHKSDEGLQGIELFFDAFQKITEGQETCGKFMARVLRDDGIKWDSALRLAQRGFERAIAAASKEAYSERISELQRLEQRMAELADRYPTASALEAYLRGENDRRESAARLTAARTLQLSIGAIRSYVIDVDRGQQVFANAVVACALAGYRAEQNQYPESLAELVPRSLPAVPEDRFAAAPLRYQRVKNGFLLYSIGPNGKDDGGLEVYDAPGTGADDLRVQVPSESPPGKK